MGCSKPHFRTPATSPTYASLVLLFFLDMGKIRTKMVFGKPLRSPEILNIWSQHHGIDQFWRYLNTELKLSSMSLENTQGAYASLGIKILSYLFWQKVSCSTRKTFHQIKLELSGKRDMLSELRSHVHDE